MIGAVVVALCASGRASAATQELTLRMNDGVDLAATLYEPDAAPPPAGYPAVVLFHGLAGSARISPRSPSDSTDSSRCSRSTPAATASRAG